MRSQILGQSLRVQMATRHTHFFCDALGSGKNLIRNRDSDFHMTRVSLRYDRRNDPLLTLSSVARPSLPKAPALASSVTQTPRINLCLAPLALSGELIATSGIGGLPRLPDEDFTNHFGPLCCNC